MNKYFPDYTKHFILWSPIVKASGVKAKHSQMADVEEIIALVWNASATNCLF